MTEAESLGARRAKTVVQIDEFNGRGIGVPTVGLFSNLGRSEYQEILSLARVRSFVRNEVLFSQGEPITRFMLIQSGSVKVSHTSFHGEEVILWIIGSGHTVGAVAEHQERLHSCSALALEGGKSLVWPFERFQMLAARHPQLQANVGAILTGRLQELEQRFSEVATDNAERRLALAVLRLVRSVGKAHQKGVRISVSGEELAQIIASTIFTVSRTLARWDKSGLVNRSRQSIVIHDVSQLEGLAAERSRRAVRRKILDEMMVERGLTDIGSVTMDLKP